MKKLLGDYLNIELLVGSMTKKEKSIIVERLLNNEIDLVIGTHALIQDSVVFNKLGLVITDEQHRFGVIQRKNLQAKGDKPDCLFMSATPIPRTFALALYGDLNVSYIKDKPVGRKPVKTEVVNEKNLKVVLQKIYEELNNNHQVFVVSPLINDNDDEEMKSVYKLEEKFNLAFNNKFNIKVLHGKLTNIEKQAIMNDFKENRINILISTTVIEVGVDIPNATMMVIFNSERFGLATLHQLRGRVGRNDLDCYCYLICNKDVERLKVLEESNDGFYISEKDLEMRKEGDLFGTRQSGVMTFNLANLYRDGKILFQAKKDCEEFIKENKYVDNPYYSDIIKEIKCLD
jgi:ATP-dependent DNA helicase RecG